MSADRWTTCPRCLKEAIADYRQRESELREKYGVVPIDEYVLCQKQLGECPTSTSLKNTLREDWEIGTDEDGEFYVRYTANCQTCSFRYEYTYGEDVTTDSTDHSVS